MPSAEHRDEVRAFLRSRRERITPQQAGLPAYDGAARRVKGLRREEVALLAGMSVDYYVRLERGNLAGASDAVLHSLARALRLDEPERAHLMDLARAAGPGRTRRARRADGALTQSIRQVLDAFTDSPAWVRNAHYDMVGANAMGRALFSPLLASGRTPANSARFLYLDPAARDFYVDYDEVADDIAAVLRSAAGRDPHDRHLIELVGELSTRSEDFRRRWAAHEVRFHRSGIKALVHPAVGRLDLTFEAMELPSAPGLTLVVYTAAPGTPASDGLKLLASWAATAEQTASRDAGAAPRPPSAATGPDVGARRSR